MTAHTFKRILITGARGFLGRHVVEQCKKQCDAEIVSVSRTDYDLLEAGEPERMIKDVQPDAVIHLAAKVGGIIANKKYPAEFFYENILLGTRMFDAAFKGGVKKMACFVGGCSYPAKAASPIGEDQMWNGYPQCESAPYSIAKKMLIVQSDAYRREYGFNSIVLIPGNIYGEYDNFNETYSHVIPAQIRRFMEARERGDKTVTCFGSGKPTRDFVYAADVAALVPWFMMNYDSSEPVNLSSGSRTSIRELSETTKKVTGFEGELVWDTSKPDGQMDKIFDVTRMKALGLACPTPLEEGMRRTAEWFIQARKTGEVRL